MQVYIITVSIMLLIIGYLFYVGWIEWKRRKKAEKELEAEKKTNESLRGSILNLDIKLQSLKQQVGSRPISANTMPPQTIISHPDVIAFAKQMQRFQKKQSCGAGGCRIGYLVPCEIIDSVAKSKAIE